MGLLPRKAKGVGEIEFINLDLSFGVLSDPLEDQLKKQGVTLKNIKKYDLCMKGISSLYIHGYLTDSERGKVYQRFMKDFERDIKNNLVSLKEG